MNLETPIEKIPKIGIFYQKKLKKLGISAIQDLLLHFPRRYEDFSNIISIAEIKMNESCSIAGQILDIENTRTWKKKMFLTKAIIKDETGAIKAVWFNQPFLTRALKKGDNVFISGKVSLGTEGPYFNNPSYERIQSFNDFEPIHSGRLVPIYSETEGVSSRWLRYIIKSFLLKFKNEIKEILPEEILEENRLLEREKAISQIHFPDSEEVAQKAKERFSFEELFLIQLSVLKEKIKLAREKSVSISLDIDLVKKFVSSLPFKLTDAQRKCVWQILKDLTKTRPMNRLLQGDVGSGKTIVAMTACLNTAKAGHQSALMAPTEILAKQHFKEFAKFLFPFKLKIGLLTSKEDKLVSVKLKNETIEVSRENLIEKSLKGEIDILVGTHSLIQDKVRFSKLALVVVDEQHRFGVRQRANLAERGQAAICHFLSMTATPIPRTLALTVYGDLDLSVLDEMPKGRKKIITKIVSPENRQKAYDFIRKEVKKDRRVFVICPRIEKSTNNESDTNLRMIWDVRAVKEEYEKLSKEVFPDLKIGMLHGKIKPKEKEKTMNKFKEGGIDILVSTSVVEVGIDIPKATIMMIEGAERFGLSQLHQFRGRVGRSQYQSYCFLFTDSSSLKTRQRLSALLKSETGFELAEKDLKIRGPGSLYGTKQWGIPDLAMEKLKDIKLVEKTRQWAKWLLEKDFELKNYPLLQESLKNFRQKTHLE